MARTYNLVSRGIFNGDEIFSVEVLLDASGLNPIIGTLRDCLQRGDNWHATHWRKGRHIGRYFNTSRAACNWLARGKNV